MGEQLNSDNNASHAVSKLLYGYDGIRHHYPAGIPDKLLDQLETTHKLTTKAWSGAAMKSLHPYFPDTMNSNRKRLEFQLEKWGTMDNGRNSNKATITCRYLRDILDHVNQRLSASSSEKKWEGRVAGVDDGRSYTIVRSLTIEQMKWQKEKAEREKEKTEEKKKEKEEKATEQECSETVVLYSGSYASSPIIASW